MKSRNGTRGIFTKALKVRVHHKEEVDLKSNYEVHKYNKSKWVGEWMSESKLSSTKKLNKRTSSFFLILEL